MHGGWVGPGSLPQLLCGRRDVGSPELRGVAALEVSRSFGCCIHTKWCRGAPGIAHCVTTSGENSNQGGN
eukprot:scaffold26279_cov64-Phaeocystis_antarctica.AAC.1